VLELRRAVDAKDAEKIVFTWQVWPDKATLEAAELRVQTDSRFDISGEIPFDAKRLIYGCFTPATDSNRKKLTWRRARSLPHP
jgi:uncharacterized protein YbaA (DUF1428 family)